MACHIENKWDFLSFLSWHDRDSRACQRNQVSQDLHDSGRQHMSSEIPGPAGPVWFVYIESTIDSANSEHLTSVAPSICRARS